MRSKDVILYSRFLTVAELSPLVIGRQIVVALIPRGCAKLLFRIRIRFQICQFPRTVKFLPRVE